MSCLIDQYKKGCGSARKEISISILFFCNCWMLDVCVSFLKGTFFFFLLLIIIFMILFTMFTRTIHLKQFKHIKFATIFHLLPFIILYENDDFVEEEGSSERKKRGRQQNFEFKSSCRPDVIFKFRCLSHVS